VEYLMVFDILNITTKKNRLITLILQNVRQKNQC